MSDRSYVDFMGGVQHESEQLYIVVVHRDAAVLRRPCVVDEIEQSEEVPMLPALSAPWQLTADPV